MSIIRLGGFRGEMPRLHPRLLPPGAAQRATNCRMDSGALESLRSTSYLQATTLSSPISLYRYSDSIWLEATTDVDWVPFPIVDDQYGRVLFADPAAGELRVTDASLVGVGGYPTNYYRLDVPAPLVGPSASLVGVPDDEEEVPETRYYVVTFVNSWGAEGPPSPPSNQVEWRTGQSVYLEGLPSVPSGAYNMTHRRIYRVNTGASGTTEYQYVSEVAFAQAQRVVLVITQDNPIKVTTATPHGLTEGQEVRFSGLGLSTTSVNIVDISKTNPVEVYTGTAPHNLATGQYVEFGDLGDTNGMDELNGNRYQVEVLDSTKVELVGVDGTGFTTYESGGTITRAYGMDELNGNQYFVSIENAAQFTLTGVDGTAYHPYFSLNGVVWQVSGNTYTDTVPSGALAEVIPTELYDPPNDATQGIKTHPAGFLVGFFGKTITCSEPGAPHAWPIDYRLSTSHDIVGLGIFGNTIAVVTKGWPYLIVGSDPSALSMVELEIEQACVAKRGIVDFGAAIVYPSPDGLILLSSSGAQNVSGPLFTRDQWQALSPETFVAFNWEQKYLCFYDNGTYQRAFIIDPFDPEAGVRFVSKYATGGFKDLEEDLLYMIVDDKIEVWDQGTKLTYNWKSAPTYTPSAVNMTAAKVFADDYPVTVDFFVDDIKRYTRVVQAGTAFRLPGGFKGEKFDVVLKGSKRVSEVIMATTMRELSVTV